MSDFAGFPREAIQFLADLGENNNREWFEANKSVYTNSLIEPAKAFIMTLGDRLRLLVPNINYDTRTNGSGSMMRIYRDVRFSKDKSPYKTWLGMVFWEGAGKKGGKPAFYFGLDAEGGGIHAGLYGFDKPMMAAYRSAVVDDALGSELDKITAAIEAAGEYGFHGEHYKRVPRGFDKEHPRANWLLYNGLHVGAPRLTVDELTSPDLVDICFEHCHNMVPLQQWLVKVQGTI